MTLYQNTVVEASNGFKSNGFLLEELKALDILFSLAQINTENRNIDYRDSLV